MTVLLYSDSHFKRPFKYSCIRTYCSNVKTRYSFFSNFLKVKIRTQISYRGPLGDGLVDSDGLGSELLRGGPIGGTPERPVRGPLLLEHQNHFRAPGAAGAH